MRVAAFGFVPPHPERVLHALRVRPILTGRTGRVADPCQSCRQLRTVRANVAAPIALRAVFGVGLRRVASSGDQVSAANPWSARFPLISPRISACHPLGSGAATSSQAAPGPGWARVRTWAWRWLYQLAPARAEGVSAGAGVCPTS